MYTTRRKRTTQRGDHEASHLWDDFEEIFTEGTDYTKKSMDMRTAFVEQLPGAKSLDAVIQIESEYARTSYTAFAAQATKMGELYSNLAKACFNPTELTMSNMQGTK